MNDARHAISTCGATDDLELWAPSVAYPAPESLTPVPGARSLVVHRADADYRFLHDCQIAVHDGELFASWYNCPRQEMAEASVIRGRRSRDGGRTWGEVEAIARAPNDAFMYVPNVFGVNEGRLWCFALRMSTADRVADGMDLFRWRKETQSWQREALIPGRFLPNHPPQALPGGGAVMAGRMAARAGEAPLVPAVAVTASSDWRQPWDYRPLLPPGETRPCPETTLIVGQRAWTAIVRPGDWVRGNPGRTALVAYSRDAGHRWSALQPTNFPMQPSKAFAGTLSSGQRYLILNSPGTGEQGRELLTISVTRPNDRRFCRMWALQNGPGDELGCGPEWSYPCAVEADGCLYIAYTSEKRHCVFSALPIESLADGALSRSRPHG